MDPQQLPFTFPLTYTVVWKLVTASLYSTSLLKLSKKSRALACESAYDHAREYSRFDMKKYGQLEASLPPSLANLLLSLFAQQTRQFSSKSMIGAQTTCYLNLATTVLSFNWITPSICTLYSQMHVWALEYQGPFALTYERPSPSKSSPHFLHSFVRLPVSDTVLQYGT